MRSVGAQAPKDPRPPPSARWESSFRLTIRPPGRHHSLAVGQRCRPPRWHSPPEKLSGPWLERAATDPSTSDEPRSCSRFPVGGLHATELTPWHPLQHAGRSAAWRKSLPKYVEQ